MYSDFILVLTIVVMMIVLVKLLCFVSLNLFGILFGIIQQKKKKHSASFPTILFLVVTE